MPAPALATPPQRAAALAAFREMNEAVVSAWAHDERGTKLRLLNALSLMGDAGFRIGDAG